MDSNILDSKIYDRIIAEDVDETLDKTTESDRPTQGSFSKMLEVFKKEQDGKNQSFMSPRVRGYKMGKHRKTNGTSESKRKDQDARRKRNKRAARDRKQNIHNRRKAS